MPFGKQQEKSLKMEDEIVKKGALAAAKKRMSSQTGFVHYYSEEPYHSNQDTIPVIENFIYGYALFRSKTVENIQEGKSLLEKLLAFEVNGNFPVYLHEYPMCKDSRNSSHLLPVLFYFLKDFPLALGESLNGKLKILSERIVAFLKGQEIQGAAKARLDSFLGQFNPSEWIPKSPEEWGEYCVCCQMAERDFFHKETLWDSTLGVFIGPSKERYQEGYEPSVSLFDLFMDNYPKRALAIDHPVYLKAALVHPWKKRGPSFQANPFISLVDEKQRQCLTLYFGALDRLHSLVLEAKKGSWAITPSVNGFSCVYEYPEEIPTDEDAMEWAFYLDDSEDHLIKVADQKATMFHPGDEVTIQSQDCRIGFNVEVDPSMGSFTGHIYKGDRSFQKSKSLPYGGYDWKFGWRTIKRSSKAQVAIHISFKI